VVEGVVRDERELACERAPELVLGVVVARQVERHVDARVQQVFAAVERREDGLARRQRRGDGDGLVVLDLRAAVERRCCSRDALQGETAPASDAARLRTLEPRTRSS
jgi:hypothetical protein